MGEKPRIVAQSVHSVSGNSKKPLSNREKWATICFHYPQYTLEEASLLPARDILLLLDTANRIEAERELLLLNMIQLPHAKEGGKIAKRISDDLIKIIEKREKK